MNIKNKDNRNGIKKIFAVLAGLLLALGFPGCAGGPVQTQEEWAAETFLKTANPEDAGIDAAAIDQLLNDISSGKWVNVHGLLIIKDGTLISEGYWHGSHAGKLHDIRSASKSIASVLMGIAVDKGYVHSAQDKLYDYFPEYKTSSKSPWKHELAIEHLLNMTSGFEYDDWSDNFKGEYEIGGSSDWIKTAAAAEITRKPGSFYAYNTGSLVLLSGIISRTSGMKTMDFTRQLLFNPLGISRLKWRSKKGVVYMGGNLWLTLRDMSKIGLLMLNNGVWNGQRLLSVGWIDEITREPAQNEPSIKRFNFFHHYLWWGFSETINRTPVRGFYASGNGGQTIMFIPDLEMVIAITTGNYNTSLESQSVQIIREAILPAVLE